MKKQILHSLFSQFTNGGFTVEYWDGDIEHYGCEEPTVKIKFNKPLPAKDALSDPSLVFGEAYMDDVLDFEGPLEEVWKLVERNKEAWSSNDWKSKFAGVIRDVGSIVDKQRQKQEIQHHYDLGNDFFSLWLDKTMSYSCGYFRHPDDSLEDAQIQKIDHTLKKLQLQPGQRLLDIGSGWGWLLVRAAKQYGIRGVGVTLSEEQVEASRKRIAEEGLSDQIEIRLQDYLDLEEDDEPFDRVVSVGMFEHVGKENLPKYMDKVHKLLKDEGLSVLHSITGLREHGVNSWINKYIFPGGYIPSFRETIWLLGDYGFHVMHAESLRLHYAKTLDHWHSNFSRHLDQVEKDFGHRFVRMWDLYLRGCAASFRTTGLNIHQILFSKGLNNQAEMTLDHVYQE